MGLVLLLVWQFKIKYFGRNKVAQSQDVKQSTSIGESVTENVLI